MKTKFTLLIVLILFINKANALGDLDNLNLKSSIYSKHPFIIKSLKSESDDEGNKGKIMLAAGVGFNLLGSSLYVKYSLDNNYNTSNTVLKARSAPMYNFSVDYGLLKNLTVGAAFGYQTATVTISNGYNYNNGNYYNYIDTWKRIHLAVRADYDIVRSQNICLYTGMKFGYNIYHMTSTITPFDPTYTTRLNVTPSPVSIQAHFGFSYYFSGIVGFNTEVGIGYGGPYLAAVGLAIKI